tara:strand:+ start:4450 stop:4932 length:483 start_codon:yes stop_codon:yes gene_type:complete
MKKEAAKQIKYSSTVSNKKQSLSEILTRVFPPTMVPTKKTGWIFGTIFVIVVIIGLLSFPLGEMLSGNLDLSVKVGIPWTFLEFDLENPETLPVKFGGLILDLFIYLIISYALDVVINVFLSSLNQKKGRKTKRPLVYRIAPKSVAEKASEKTHEIIGKK